MNYSNNYICNINFLKKITISISVILPLILISNINNILPKIISGTQLNYLIKKSSKLCPAIVYPHQTVIYTINDMTHDSNYNYFLMKFNNNNYLKVFGKIVIENIDIKLDNINYFIISSPNINDINNNINIYKFGKIIINNIRSKLNSFTIILCCINLINNGLLKIENCNVNQLIYNNINSISGYGEILINNNIIDLNNINAGDNNNDNSLYPNIYNKFNNNNNNNEINNNLRAVPLSQLTNKVVALLMSDVNNITLNINNNKINTKLNNIILAFCYYSNINNIKFNFNKNNNLGSCKTKSDVYITNIYIKPLSINNLEHVINNSKIKFENNITGNRCTNILLGQFLNNLIINNSNIIINNIINSTIDKSTKSIAVHQKTDVNILTNIILNNSIINQSGIRFSNTKSKYGYLIDLSNSTINQGLGNNDNAIYGKLILNDNSYIIDDNDSNNITTNIPDKYLIS